MFVMVLHTPGAPQRQEDRPDPSRATERCGSGSAPAVSAALICTSSMAICSRVTGLARGDRLGVPWLGENGRFLDFAARRARRQTKAQALGKGSEIAADQAAIAIRKHDLDQAAPWAPR